MADLETKKCDFCSSPYVRYEYPCKTFRTLAFVFSAQSLEEWAACETCSTLIENGEWQLLATHALVRFTEQFGLEPREAGTIRPMVVNFHQEFQKNRTGERRVYIP